MMITLKTPYTVGDLAPDDKFPHVYITTFYVNGPGLSATITYEIGTMGPQSNDFPLGQWAKAPLVPAASLQISGADLYPFFMTQVQSPKAAVAEDDTTDPPTPAQPAVSGALWDQVEALMYSLIQKNDARLVGDVG